MFLSFSKFKVLLLSMKCVLLYRPRSIIIKISLTSSKISSTVWIRPTSGLIKRNAFKVEVIVQINTKFSSKLWFLNLTDKQVENTRRSRAFLTCLSVFRNQRMNTFECLNLYLKLIHILRKVEIKVRRIWL